MPHVSNLTDGFRGLPIHIRTQQGFGDCVYARPVVGELCRLHPAVSIETPWPFLFEDMKIDAFVRPQTELRTQLAHVENVQFDFWKPRDWNRLELQLNYINSETGINVHRSNTVTESIARQAGVVVTPEMFQFSATENRLRTAKSILKSADVPGEFIIVHYPTVRREWANCSRNPMQGYLAFAARRVSKELGLPIVSIAWVEESGGQEEFAENDRPADFRFEHGEVPMPELVAMTQLSAGVISGPCFFLPLCPALSTPWLGLFGGHIAPAVLLDRQRMPLDDVVTVAPEPFCDCFQNWHACEKKIPAARLEAAIARFINKIDMRRRTPLARGAPLSTGQMI